MGAIYLLDCTLRDGGYINQWNFGNGTMICIYDRLTEAGVDIIEVGFLDEREPFDMERSIQPNTNAMNICYHGTVPKKAMVLAMIDIGTCSIENIQPKEDTILDGIRVIFKKERMYEAIDFAEQLTMKGYQVFLQLVSITDYKKEDIKKLADYCKKIRPYAVSIVDTYGLMHQEQVHDYFGWLDEYLEPSISIGYHSHNNFQLAYSNTIELLNMKTDRNMILDGTLYGMGKSAGNAPLELLAMYLNENCGKNYNLSQILEAINSEILPIHEKYYWGYSQFFFISAQNGCHPNYVKFLMDKKTLSIKDVNIILSRIESDRKLRYSEEYIETLYGEYVLENIDDSNCIECLKKEFSGKTVLILGPGRTVIDQTDTIKEFINNENPIIMSTNFVPEEIKIDFLFISNPLRYSLIIPKIANKDIKVIGTSNVTPVGRSFDYTLRYDLLIAKNTIWDNSLAILLNFFKKVGVKEIALAGFDGFVKDPQKNYFDTGFDLSKSYEYLSSVNRCMTKMISDTRADMNVLFITPSIYEGYDNSEDVIEQ